MLMLSFIGQCHETLPSPNIFLHNFSKVKNDGSEEGKSKGSNVDGGEKDKSYKRRKLSTLSKS